MCEWVGGCVCVCMWVDGWVVWMWCWWSGVSWVGGVGRCEVCGSVGVWVYGCVGVWMWARVCGPVVKR